MGRSEGSPGGLGPTGYRSKKPTLPPTHSLSLLKLTPIIFPLLSRARLIAGVGRGAPSFHRYIIRISALAGTSGVGIRSAYLTVRWRIQFSGFFTSRSAGC